MDLIIWRDAFATGFPRVDNQHKHLVSLINQLYHSLGAKDKDEKMKAVFNELYEYTVNHFSLEEAIMREANYTHYLSHKDEHSQFIIKIKTFKEDFLLGNKKVNLDVLNFLKEWLLKHIMKTDKVTFENFKD